MRGLWLVAVVALACAAASPADVVVQQWGAGERFTHPRTVTVEPLGTEGEPSAGAVAGGPWVMRLDLKDLPANAEILRASLCAFRPVVDGTDESALKDVEVFVLEDAPAPGRQPKLAARPLAPEGPWYASFDLTEVLRGWVKEPASNRGLYVKAFPSWQPERTYLEVAYKGQSGSVPQQVRGLKVLHRAGQTFITWQEIENKVAKDAVTLGELKALLEESDKTRRLRYRLYRHGDPITAANLEKAELLGEVAPLSVYNVNGRSVEELIAQTRRRAIEDFDLAKKLAKTEYFARYNPDMPEMSEVIVKRLAIEEEVSKGEAQPVQTRGRPLPAGTGLYVHQAAKAGKACYAVAVSVDGTANCRDFSPENSLQAPVEESPGAGEPVLQGTADVTVFYDYPGIRLHYVQWAGPPLSHLPNQYYNWGVFIPRGYPSAKVRRLSIYFHDMQQRYLKPPWPHRQDTVLLSPHDCPFRSFGYGYHEALGTLRSFNQGTVQPFLARRVDAVREWAVKKFQADPGCVSCGGSGYWGGTAALQYGLHRPGKIACVMADGSPDPDPQQLPASTAKERTPRGLTEAVWGKPAWAVKCESGKTVWEEMNLPAYVRAASAPLPFVSLGAGSQHLTWKQETDLMRAYLESRNAFMAEFFWGSSAHLPLPVTPESGDQPFEPRTDQPLLACNPKGLDLNPPFYDSQFLTGKRGYNSGSRLNTKPRWRPDDVVDTPGRLELTIFAGQVVYAGSDTVETAIRNAQQFRCAAGEKVVWSVLDAKSKQKRQGGEVAADEKGIIVIPGLTFAAPARLVVERAQAASAPAK